MSYPTYSSAWNLSINSFPETHDRVLETWILKTIFTASWTALNSGIIAIEWIPILSEWILVYMIVENIVNFISRKDRLIKHMHDSVSLYLWPSVVHVCRWSATWNRIERKQPRSWRTSNIWAAGTPAYYEALKKNPRKKSTLFTEIAMETKIITSLPRRRVKRHVCLLEMLRRHRHDSTIKNKKMQLRVILAIWRYVCIKHDDSVLGWVHWCQNGEPWLPLLRRWRITALQGLPTPIFIIDIFGAD